MAEKAIDRVYDLITSEGEERSCEAIPEEACATVPGNFFRNVANGACTKLAEQLVSPGTTLPWIFTTLGVPSALAGALVPIKDAGSLLPQLLVSARIRAYPVRKWFWVVPALVQAATLVAMAFVVLSLSGLAAGFGVLALVALFNVASGVASLAFKDVVAKTIPKGRRGQMLALRSSLGGVLTLGAGVWLFALVRSGESASSYFWLIIVAATLWLIAAALFARIREADGATEGGRTPLSEIKQAWTCFRSDANLRRFIFTRGLLMAIPLAQPFFIVLGRTEIGDQVASLGVVVVAAGIANVVSSPFWGRFSDRSSRLMMVAVALLGIANIALMLSFPFWPEAIRNVFGFSVLLMIQVVAHAGARLSRKTYLLDFAPGSERPLYVSLSNTMIGIFTLVAAGLTAIASIWSVEAMLLVLATLLAGAALLGLRLQET